MLLFSFHLCISLQTNQDRSERWLFEIASCAVWLYCYNPRCSCSCFVLFLKRRQGSEWWWKQRCNERDLLCADIPSSLSCLWNTLCGSSCGNVAVKASSRAGKNHHVDTEIPDSRKVQSLLYLCLALHPHALFGIQKWWRPLGDLQFGNSASRTCSYRQQQLKRVWEMTQVFY